MTSQEAPRSFGISNPSDAKELKQEVEPSAKRLQRYAKDTWSCFTALTDSTTGLPDDKIFFNRDGSLVASGCTSPTNIAACLWGTIAARDLDIITPQTASQSIDKTLSTLESMRRHEGLYLNWYDPSTAEPTKTRLKNGEVVRPFVSTVDNAWLATAFMVVRKAEPQATSRIDRLLHGMNFDFLYNSEKGFFSGGYWIDNNEYSTWCYDVENTEARIAYYVAMGEFEMSPDAYHRLNRTMSPRTDFQEPNPEHTTVVRSWEGTMFEDGMVPLFVPEAKWAPNSWGENHNRYVLEQIRHGQQYNGYWGFSACEDPSGTYRLVGIPTLGMDPGRNSVDPIITPYASFLALQFVPQEALRNLISLERNFPGLYRKDFGFADSVNVETGEIARAYLAVDQGMCMAAALNYLKDNRMHDYFSPQIESVVQPILSREVFFDR